MKKSLSTQNMFLIYMTNFLVFLFFLFSSQNYPAILQVHRNLTNFPNSSRFAILSNTIGALQFGSMCKYSKFNVNHKRERDENDHETIKRDLVVSGLMHSVSILFN